MEERKQKEIEYYDRKSEEWLKEEKDQQTDFKGFSPTLLSSYNFLYQLLEKYCKGKKVLDYGCGNGIHSVFLEKCGAEVVGIDLSEGSLEVARMRVKKEGVEDKVKFLLMDCEKMDFPDNSFDVILDGGTFSSLDLNKAYPELFRVLKPEGVLLGAETFGHNPFTNFKRQINKITGKRTGWAVEHIFNQEDLEKVKSYFSKIEVYYFHLISWLAFPFLSFPGGKAFLKIIEFKDRILLRMPFLRKWAFKVVFIFSKPKKYG